MTISELSQLYRLKQEIRRNADRIEALTLRALPGAQVINDIPHGSGAVSDRVGDIAAKLADLRGIITAQQAQALYEQARLERYIMQVPDSVTRQAMVLRFVEGLSWAAVARKLGGTTPDACRMCVVRYADSTPEDDHL